VPSSPECIDVEETYTREYLKVYIAGLPEISSLIDGGAEYNCARDDLIRPLDLPVVKQIAVKGLNGQAMIVDVVRLRLKGSQADQDKKGEVNYAPDVRIWAALIKDLNEPLIITPTTADLLRETALYSRHVADTPETAQLSDAQTAVWTETGVGEGRGEEVEELRSLIGEDFFAVDLADSGSVVEPSPEETDIEEQFFKPEVSSPPKGETAVDQNKLAAEQTQCSTLASLGVQEENEAKNFFIEDRFLEHKDKIAGHPVKQLCLPKERVDEVLNLEHDASGAGHMALKATKDQIKLNNCSILFEKDEDFGHAEAVGSFGTSQTRPSTQTDPNAIAHLTVPERKQLCKLLDRVPEVFSDKPGFCPLLEHTITVSTDFRPKSLRAYKVPELLKPEVEKQIRELLTLGIIIPSHNEMSSPMVCIVKRGEQGGLRLAIDYRYINKFSADDTYPTPDIQEVLQKVGSANFISCFDTRQGYYQIGLHKDSRWLSAFVCGAGLFEFVRLPFELGSASNAFILCVSRVLHPIRDFTETFVDDMAVHSISWPHHVEHLEKYLMTIRRSGLTLNIGRSSFARGQATFVGHLIGSGSIEPDPPEIAGRGKIPQPGSRKDIRRSIGFFSYFRNFIPNLAETAGVLTDLTQRSVPAEMPWRVEQQNALDKLAHDLNNAVCLRTIDYSREFGLSTDASDGAVGCCVFQTQDDGTERPMCFASSRWDTAQARWSTVKRGACAAICALRKFRNWMFMSRTTLYSNHNPLTFLTVLTPTSAKLARWALALQDFDIVFKYRPGSLNIPADLLSRL